MKNKFVFFLLKIKPSFLLNPTYFTAFCISCHISSICSNPIVKRTKPSVIPTSKLCSEVNFEWFFEVGCVSMLRVSPKLAVNENKFNSSKNFIPASKPPFSSKLTIPPPFFLLFYLYLLLLIRFQKWIFYPFDGIMSFQTRRNLQCILAMTFHSHVQSFQ